MTLITKTPCNMMQKTYLLVSLSEEPRYLLKPCYLYHQALKAVTQCTPPHSVHPTPLLCDSTVSEQSSEFGLLSYPFDTVDLCYVQRLSHSLSFACWKNIGSLFGIGTKGKKPK